MEADWATNSVDKNRSIARAVCAICSRNERRFWYSERTRCGGLMDILDTLLGGLVGGFIGVILGVTVQSYFRPLSAAIEQRSRRYWANPLIVHIERDPSIIWLDAPDWVGFSVYMDDPMRLQGAPPADRAEWLNWAKRQNCVDAYVTPLKITLQARSEAAVVIEGVRLRRHRSKPIESGMILSRPVGGAELQPRRFEVNLDPSLVDVDWIDGGDEPTHPPSFVLAAGDVERFHIWGRTDPLIEESVWHEWSIELLLLVEGNRRVFSFDDIGKPFVTVSGGNLPQRFNLGGTNTWSDSSDSPSSASD
jgi:hypothetical protein